MEYLIRYKWFFIAIAAVALVVILYHFVYIPYKNKSTDTKKISEPSIYEAKKSLEKKIFANDFVTSIGTRQIDSKSFIQIGVKSEDHIKDIQALLTDGKWNGFSVDILVEQPSVAQATISQKPQASTTVKTSWHFKTIITGISANQKRLAVNMQAGDKLIPSQFKQAQTIKLHIQQTSDYIYDTNAKIISIDPNRDSMLVSFVGKVTDNAFGEAELNS